MRPADSLLRFMIGERPVDYFRRARLFVAEMMAKRKRGASNFYLAEIEELIRSMKVIQRVQCVATHGEEILR